MTDTKLPYDVTTALTLIIPYQFENRINNVRSKYDRAYPRWMPHVNFIFPFIDSFHFGTVVDKLKLAFVKNNIKPFTLKLNQLEYFKRKRDVTFHLKAEDQSELENVFNVIKSTLPNVAIKHPTFQAHMTLGQCPKNDYEALKSEIEKQLELDTLHFEVSGISIIQRSKDDKNAPFSLVHQITFME